MTTPVKHDPTSFELRTPAHAEPLEHSPGSAWSFERSLLGIAALANIAAVLAFFRLDLGMFLSPEVLVLLAPGLIFAAAAIVWGRAWLYLVAGLTLAALPVVVLFVFGEAFRVSPLVPNEWLGAGFLLVALVVSLAAGVHGFRSARQGRRLPLGAWRRTTLGLAVIVLAAAVAGGAGTALVAEQRSQASALGGGYDFVPETSVTVVMEDYAFVPLEIPIQAGVLTEVVVENRDSASHTLTYEKDGTTYNHEILPERTAKFLVLFGQAGTVPFRCLPHSDGYENPEENMVGSFLVTEA